MSSTSLQDGVQYANPKSEELSTIFQFHHLKVDYKDGKKWHHQDFDFIELKRILSNWQLASQQEQALVALFLNNHDQPRSVSRFGDVDDYHYESATLLASAIHNMRGIVYIYQGEEIGLPNAEFKDIETFKDIESLNAYQLIEGDHEAKMTALRHHSRDNGRTPMPWTKNDKNHGFTTGTPWLDLSHDEHMISVEASLEDPNSIFGFYKNLIELRHQDEVIQKGVIRFIDLEHPQLLNYIRTYACKTYLFINNFFKKGVTYSHKYDILKVVLSNYSHIELGSNLTLRPYETIVIEIKEA